MPDELPSKVAEAIQDADLLSASSSAMRARNIADSLRKADYFLVSGAELAELARRSSGSAPDIPGRSGFRVPGSADQLKCPLPHCYYRFPASLWGAARAEHAGAHPRSEWDEMLVGLWSDANEKRAQADEAEAWTKAEIGLIEKWKALDFF